MNYNYLVAEYQQYLLEISTTHPTNERLIEMKESDANEYFAFLAEGRVPVDFLKPDREDYERSPEYTLLDELIAKRLNETRIEELGGPWALFDELY